MGAMVMVVVVVVVVVVGGDDFVAGSLRSTRVTNCWPETISCLTKLACLVLVRRASVRRMANPLESGRLCICAHTTKCALANGGRVREGRRKEL